MKPTNKPQNKLNGIEYLLLSIQTYPGKSQRFHLRRLYTYQNGKQDYWKGGTNCGYFTSSSYRNVVWFDASDKTVEYEAYNPVDGNISWGKASKSKCAQMHLTKYGIKRANDARIKLGLKPV